MKTSSEISVSLSDQIYDQFIDSLKSDDLFTESIIKQLTTLKLEGKLSKDIQLEVIFSEEEDINETP